MPSVTLNYFFIFLKAVGFERERMVSLFPGSLQLTWWGMTKGKGKGWSGKISAVMKHRRSSSPEQWKIIPESSQEKGVRTKEERKMLKFSRIFERMFFHLAQPLGNKKHVCYCECIQILLGLEHVALQRLRTQASLVK